MLVRIAFAATAAFAFSQLRRIHDRPPALPRFRRIKESVDGSIQKMQNCSGVNSAPQEEAAYNQWSGISQNAEEREVKHLVSSVSPPVKPEFEDLFLGGGDFPLDSGSDGRRNENNCTTISLCHCSELERERIHESNCEDSETLEASTSSNNRKFKEASKADHQVSARLACGHNEGMKAAGADSASKSLTSSLKSRDFSDWLVTAQGTEITRLRIVITEMQEKGLKLEAQLLEYCGLKKKQEKSHVELERQSRQKDAQIDNLKLKIASLESQTKEMMEELSATDDLRKDLEAARAKIGELQKQIQSDASHKKENLLLLKQQVTILQETEEVTSREVLDKNLQTSKELEAEIVELRRTSLELQRQNQELALDLVAANTRIAEISNATESNLLTRAEAEVSDLRNTNEELIRQVEGLQINRFSEIEELVYLRWVNACLRHELHNHKAPPGKLTALDLSKSMSPSSLDQAKQLMLEYAGPEIIPLKSKEPNENDFDSMSSQQFTPIEYGDSRPSAFDNGSAWQSRSKKPGLIKNMKNWAGISGDDSLRSPGSFSSDSRSSLGSMSPKHRRHSASSVSILDAYLQRNNSDFVATTPRGTNESNTATSRFSPSNSFGRKSGSYHLQPSPAPSSPISCASIAESPRSISLYGAKSVTENDDVAGSVAASFQHMSKSAAIALDDKFPTFKDLHKLAQAKKEKAENLVEKPKGETPMVVKIPERAKEEKLSKTNLETVSGRGHTREHTEVSKKNLEEIKKSDPRVAKPGSQPAAGGAVVRNNPFTGSVLRSATPAPPPPPSGAAGATPAPPPPRNLIKLQGQGRDKVKKAPEAVEFYQSVFTRREEKKDPITASIEFSKVTNDQRNMTGDIENQSTFLLAVKADVETKGDFIQSLATEIRAAAYRNIEDVIAFVNWLDEEVSYLVHERAVLKHFDWPENKVDALREAAFQYQNMKKLEAEINSYEDQPQLPCDSALKMLLSMLEKSEESVDALLRTRDMTIARYKEFNIPTYWMLDSGLIARIRLASVQLAKKYMARVTAELDALGATPEKEPLKDFLLLQGVRFAFRVHQFAGGFDEESMLTFEDLKNRVNCHTADHQQSYQIMKPPT